MLRTHAPDRRGRRAGRGRRGGAARGDLPRPAGVPVPPGQHRVLGDRDPCAPASRWPTRSSTRTSPAADARHLRAKTVLTPYVFATERPRRLTAEEKDVLAPFLEERLVRQSPGSPRSRAWDPGHYPAPRALLRRRRLRPRQQREVLRVLPGGADPAACATSSSTCRATGDTRVVVAQTDVDYRVPILFRPEPYDVWSWITRVGTRSFTIESEIRDGETLLSRARVVLVCFDPRRRSLGGPPAGAPRRDAGRPRGLSALRRGAHSSVLTMNCAAWVT